MACTTVPLASLPWTADGHPLERKKSVGAGLPILIEFAPGFRDPHICTRGHVIYVLTGALGLELSDRHEVVEAGACCVLDAGTEHRAYTDGTEPVSLFIISS